MEITAELKQTLKRLRLSQILPTLPDRAAFAKANKTSPLEFLEIVLSDEVSRRDQGALTRKIRTAGLNPDEVMERFDWDAPITLDRDYVRGLMALDWIDRKENVILTGPVGVGKTFLANALAHMACRQRRSVRMVKAAHMFKSLRAARADNSLDREITALVAIDLLVIDDFGLTPLSPEQSQDFYEIVTERYRRASTLITSNRHVDEWLALIADPILANSAFDRLAHNAHQLVIEGESYRKTKGGPTMNL